MHYIYAHLIGDFLIQNDWMAKGKKHSSIICLVHTLTYLIPFLFVANPPPAFSDIGRGLFGAVFFHPDWWQLALIGAQHFIQDRTNIVTTFMHAKGSTSFAQQPLAPWSIILTDNILHVLFVAWVMSL